MTDTPITRPVPRWVRAWAVLTVAATVVLLILGGFVTSFRVGMADPVWPTEPWYLLGRDWARLEFGFLVEHTHRLAGFAVGGLTVILALGAWWSEPNPPLRRFALAAVVFLVVTFGLFHGAMMQSWKQSKAVTPLTQATGAASVIGALAVLAACGQAAAGSHPGRWVRALAGVGLILVMVQGLLGGLRVFLNELVGTDLAAVHGVFAQVTFCALVAVALLAAPRRGGDTLPEPDRPRFVRLAWGLVAVTFVQLVWAVMVRHQGSPLAQRLHLLTAFAVTAAAVWLAVRILGSPPAKARLGGQAYHLLGILAVQLLLGVEAYMGKFAAAGPDAQTPPMLRQVTIEQAGTRTAHQLVGTGLLAAAVALGLRAGRRPVGVTRPPADAGEETLDLRLPRSPAAAPVP